MSNHVRWCNYHKGDHGCLYLCPHYDNATRTIVAREIMAEQIWFHMFFHIRVALDDIATYQGGP